MTIPLEPPPGEQAAERSRRIEMSVERAVAQRQRMIRIYLVLLVVPLAVAAAFLVWGRTDREIVAEEVATQVDERVQPVEQSYREVAPILADVREAGELLPEIRQAGERQRELATTVGGMASRVEVLASEVEELKPAVEGASADLRRLASSVAAADEARAEVEGLRRDLEAQQRRLDTLNARLSRAEELTRSLTPREGIVREQPDDARESSLRELQRAVDVLQREVRALRAGRGDPP